LRNEIPASFKDAGIFSSVGLVMPRSPMTTAHPRGFEERHVFNARHRAGGYGLRPIARARGSSNFAHVCANLAKAKFGIDFVPC
jgi:hypothetical protein